MRVGKTLERGGTEKKGGEKKVLKRGDKLGQGRGALKNGDWNLFMNYGNNKRNKMKKETEKVWSKDKILVRTEESAESII